MCSALVQFYHFRQREQKTFVPEMINVGEF